MNHELEATLDLLADALYVVEAWDNEYVLFGSTVLYLHEIRDDVGDVDIFVNRRVYAQVATLDGWTELAPQVGDPPFLELASTPPVHAFYDWTARDQWISVQACFARAELVGAWSCTPLDEILKHKREALAHWDGEPGRQDKHVRDIALIETHLGTAA